MGMLKRNAARGLYRCHVRLCCRCCSLLGKAKGTAQHACMQHARPHPTHVPARTARLHMRALLLYAGEAKLGAHGPALNPFAVISAAVALLLPAAGCCCVAAGTSALPVCQLQPKRCSKPAAGQHHYQAGSAAVLRPLQRGPGPGGVGVGGQPGATRRLCSLAATPRGHGYTPVTVQSSSSVRQQQH